MKAKRIVRTYKEGDFTVNVLASGKQRAASKTRASRAAAGKKVGSEPLKPHDYGEYIRSRAWAQVKKRYRASKLPQRCVVCGDPRVDLHHRTYKRLGNEHLTDLVPLCRPHHDEVHAMVKGSANRSKVNLWSAVGRLRKAHVKAERRDRLEGALDMEYLARIVRD